MILLIVLAVLAIFIVWLIATYNRLVELRNRMANAYAQIDVQLKRRHDLIPNLVETAKAYMAHERTTLEAVIAARNTAQAASAAAATKPGDAVAMNAMAQAESALSGTLGRFFALAESYPDLKANENMLQLSEELTSTENKVTFARQAFNDSVMQLNTAVQSFPAVAFAGALGFSLAQMLQPIGSDAEREPPAVKF
jgi:LemA protein